MGFSAGTFTYSGSSTTFSAPTTGTTISSTAAAAAFTETAAGLSTCLLKDGTQTVTGNIPMATFKFTGLAAGSASGDSIRYEQVLGVVTTAGDLIYATAAGTLARLAIGTAGQSLTVNSGATAPQWASVPVLGTEQATTSGTAINFTSIPAWAKKITIEFVGVSTSGTDDLLIQLGDSGDIEATTYLGASAAMTNAGATVGANYTTGFGIVSGAATNVFHGSVTLYLEDSTGFTWVASGVLAVSNGATALITAGSKSLSAALDRVRITTISGTDTFDAGAINILYE